MEEQQRKERFIELLQELLDQSDGVKMKLAQKLEIKPSTLTPWLQGKIDPASLDVLVFERIAALKSLSVDEVAILLGVIRRRAKQPLENKFRSLIDELLSTRSQQVLAEELGVSQNTISSWINPQRNIDPSKINIATMAAIALEKKWTIERLLIYLGLKEKKAQENLFSRIKLEISSLSSTERLELLEWFSNIVQEEKVAIKSDNKVLLILENLFNAEHYLDNLVRYARIKKQNISIATATKIPEPLSDFDVLVVDVASDESPCISLIERIEFDGALVVFADSGLSEAIRAHLLSQATDLLIKPIPWIELKDKSYFL